MADFGADPVDVVTLCCENHREELVSGLWNFFQSRYSVDYDVALGGQATRAHRLILDVFLTPETLQPNPYEGDPKVGSGCLNFLVEFLYRGVVNVPRDRLDSLLELAKVSGFQLLVDAVEYAAEKLSDKRVACRTDSGIINLSDSELPAVNSAKKNNTETENGDFLRWSVRVQKKQTNSTKTAETTKARDNVTAGVSRKVKEGGTTKSSPRNRKKTKQNRPEKETRSGKQESTAPATTSRLHRCSRCEASFKSKPTLTRHMLTHTKERSHCCESCKRTFSRSDALLVHSRSCGRTTGDDAAGVGNRFGCDSCEKTFSRPESMRAHARTHFVVKSHDCPVCGKAFALYRNMISHAETH